MLTEQQLINWFRTNGVDIGIPVPTPLLGRLFKKAVSYDTALFVFLGKSCFTAHNDKGLLVLKFDNWSELFSCYSLYNATHSVMKA